MGAICSCGEGANHQRTNCENPPIFSDVVKAQDRPAADTWFRWVSWTPLRRTIATAWMLLTLAIGFVFWVTTMCGSLNGSAGRRSSWVAVTSTSSAKGPWPPCQHGARSAGGLASPAGESQCRGTRGDCSRVRAKPFLSQSGERSSLTRANAAPPASRLGTGRQRTGFPTSRGPRDSSSCRQTKEKSSTHLALRLGWLREDICQQEVAL